MRPAVERCERSKGCGRILYCWTDLGSILIADGRANQSFLLLQHPLRLFSGTADIRCRIEPPSTTPNIHHVLRDVGGQGCGVLCCWLVTIDTSLACLRITYLRPASAPCRRRPRRLLCLCVLISLSLCRPLRSVPISAPQLLYLSVDPVVTPPSHTQLLRVLSFYVEQREWVTRLR